MGCAWHSIPWGQRVLTIFAIILIDLIGFGILVPILIYYAEQLGATPFEATAVASLYVMGLIIATPVMGRLSDLYGRRPILMLSMLGATAGYLMMAAATDLWMIGFARLVAGLMAGNISAAQAYIADITTEENRAKGMGMIGAAFGLGFIIGPALGAVLAGDDFASANFALPCMVSAGMSFAAFVAVVFVLPESLTKQERQQARARPREKQFAAFKRVLSQPVVLKIVLAGFLFNSAAGLFESIFPLWGKHMQVLTGPQDMAPILLVGGMALVLVQGGLIGPLTRRFGENLLLMAGALIYGLSLLLMSYSGTLQWVLGVYLAMATISVGSALVLTSMQSLVSQCAARTEHGAVMGVYNSFGTLGRFIGTFSAGAVFSHLGKQSNYLLGAGFMLLLFFVALQVRRNWSDRPEVDQGLPEAS
jgi:MFS family permease